MFMLPLCDLTFCLMFSLVSSSHRRNKSTNGYAKIANEGNPERQAQQEDHNVDGDCEDAIAMKQTTASTKNNVIKKRTIEYDLMILSKAVPESQRVYQAKEMLSFKQLIESGDLPLNVLDKRMLRYWTEDDFWILIPGGIVKMLATSRGWKVWYVRLCLGLEDLNSKDRNELLTIGKDYDVAEAILSKQSIMELFTETAFRRFDIFNKANRGGMINVKTIHYKLAVVGTTLREIQHRSCQDGRDHGTCDCIGYLPTGFELSFCYDNLFNKVVDPKNGQRLPPDFRRHVEENPDIRHVIKGGCRDLSMTGHDGVRLDMPNPAFSQQSPLDISDYSCRWKSFCFALSYHPTLGHLAEDLCAGLGDALKDPKKDSKERRAICASIVKQKLNGRNMENFSKFNVITESDLSDVTYCLPENFKKNPFVWEILAGKNIHYIAIYNGLIFDPAESHAMDLTMDNLLKISQASLNDNRSIRVLSADVLGNKKKRRGKSTKKKETA